MRSTIALLTLFFTSGAAFAQLTERPLPIKPTSTFESRIAGIEGGGSGAPLMVLPFWEDFSTSNSIPNTAKWHNSEAVRIAGNIGIGAPSLNVAVFDGVDENGIAYNPSGLINGPADCLTSAIIDLSTMDADQADSVYLSFFWQLKGSGELADEEDSLVLQFQNTDQEWVTVWSINGGIDNLAQEFQQQLIQVPAPLFHANFQFRFRAFSNLSGPFDTWLIDYIYLNQNRHDDDVAYLDRALTTPGNFLTAPYTAMPTEQFFADPSKYLTELSVGFFNLNSFFQPILYSAEVRDLVTDKEVQILNNQTVVTPFPDGFERLTFTSPALDPINLDADADSLWLESKFFIQSGDVFFIEDISSTNDTTFNQQIDYRLNDTVRHVTVLDDYLAYDDNEVDFAAGINQNGGRLAYRYVLENRSLLTHIDINFPFIQQTGEPIQLMVWKDIGGERDSVQFRDPYSVQRSNFVGELRPYQLDTPIFVQDTIYIGFEQATNEFLAVGLDKNTDSGTHMFFNVDGTWQPNEFVQGSFLMRPRFDKSIAATFVPVDDPGIIDPDIYPNPSEGSITIKGEIDELLIYNSWGQPGKFTAIRKPGRLVVDLSKNESGIYLIKLVINNKTITKRIILNN